AQAPASFEHLRFFAAQYLAEQLVEHRGWVDHLGHWYAARAVTQVKPQSSIVTAHTEHERRYGGIFAQVAVDGQILIQRRVGPTCPATREDHARRVVSHGSDLDARRQINAVD